MKKVVEMIILEKEKDYRDEFKSHFVDNVFKFKNIPVEFYENDFNHIFYEPSKKGGHCFSERRAKRMYFIKNILEEGVKIELNFEEHTGNFAIFCKDLECVVYLRIRKGSGKLQIGTFIDFGKNHTKMYQKQKRKCEPIDDTHFLKIIKDS